MPLMDAKMERLAEPFAHWNTICDGDEFNQVTRFLNLLTCGNNIMGNYLDYLVEEDELDTMGTLNRYPDVFTS
jgi:hypothetical protein